MDAVGSASDRDIRAGINQQFRRGIRFADDLNRALSQFGKHSRGKIALSELNCIHAGNRSHANTLEQQLARIIFARRKLLPVCDVVEEHAFEVSTNTTQCGLDALCVIAPSWIVISLGGAMQQALPMAWFAPRGICCSQCE